MLLLQFVDHCERAPLLRAVKMHDYRGHPVALNASSRLLALTNNRRAVGHGSITSV